MSVAITNILELKRISDPSNESYTFPDNTTGAVIWLSPAAANVTTMDLGSGDSVDLIPNQPIWIKDWNLRGLALRFNTAGTADVNIISFKNEIP